MKVMDWHVTCEAGQVGNVSGRCRGKGTWLGHPSSHALLESI